MAESAPFSWMNLMRPHGWEWHCCEVMSIKCRCERGARSPSHVCPGGRDMELDTDKIVEAVQATRLVARTNTNLGIILLLSPLAAVPAGESLRDGLLPVLDRLDIADADATYEAIRLANPGGLGRVPEQDVSHEPTQNLR